MHQRNTVERTSRRPGGATRIGGISLAERLLLGGRDDAVELRVQGFDLVHTRLCKLADTSPLASAALISAALVEE